MHVLIGLSYSSSLPRHMRDDLAENSAKNAGIYRFALNVERSNAPDTGKIFNKQLQSMAEYSEGIVSRLDIKESSD